MGKINLSTALINSALLRSKTDGYFYLKGDPENSVDGDKRSSGAGTTHQLETYDGDAGEWIAGGQSLGGEGVELDAQVVATGTGNVLATRLKKNAGEFRISPYYTFNSSGEVSGLKNAYYPDEVEATLTENDGTTNHEAVLDGDVYKIGISVAQRSLNYTVFSRIFRVGNTLPTAPIKYSTFEDTDALDSDKLLISRWLPTSLFTSATAGDYIEYQLADPQGNQTPISELASTDFYVQLESSAPFSLYGDAAQPLDKSTALRFVEEYLKTDCNCHFGDEFEKFQSLSESTATTVWTEKIDATTASKPAGTYRIGFQCEITETSASEEVRFMVDGVAIHNHTTGNDELEPNLEEYNWTTISGLHYITLSSASTIDINIQHKDSGYGKMSNATIEIWRVS